MSYTEAVSYTLLGASITVFSSVYFQHRLTRLSKNLMQCWPGVTERKKVTFNPRLKKTLIFYRRYGFWGLMLLTPILIGLPVGVWLALRLGSRPSHVVIAVLIIALGWSTLSYFLTHSGLMQLANA
jgi:hypothetical protein|tara:strand:- start:6303 stop:6680 length:378 start_codon:yes stop_codon:yes gene_type:complete